jgi:hypothetical protein
MRTRLKQPFGVVLFSNFTKHSQLSTLQSGLYTTFTVRYTLRMALFQSIAATLCEKEVQIAIPVNGSKTWVVDTAKQLLEKLRYSLGET